MLGIALGICGGFCGQKREDSSSPSGELALAKRSTQVVSPTPLRSRAPGYIDTLKNGFTLLAKKTEPFLDGTPFKIPIAVLNSFIDLASTVSDNKGTLRALLEQLVDTLDVVNEAMEQATSDDAKGRARRLSQ
ncbi:hypothetical protein FB45DRAFT_920193 [Roridomyces roridus]|uniref:Uncharacterized protein n=1 Tax=Roridomyces roridus TaxID=1738132 RepID=A0AAD7BPN3_9AGAR|nr:hypothetical protein FB45DRAFT_920193 [Roridomyces roridus]